MWLGGFHLACSCDSFYQRNSLTFKWALFLSWGGHGSLEYVRIMLKLHIIFALFQNECINWIGRWHLPQIPPFHYSTDFPNVKGSKLHKSHRIGNRILEKSNCKWVNTQAHQTGNATFNMAEYNEKMLWFACFWTYFAKSWASSLLSLIILDYRNRKVLWVHNGTHQILIYSCFPVLF